MLRDVGNTEIRTKRTMKPLTKSIIESEKYKEKKERNKVRKRVK